MHSEDLFRIQAIKALAKKRPGRPICLVPNPWLWLNGLLLLIFLSAAVFVGTTKYSRKETVRGWLISRAGVVRVVSNSAAVVGDVTRSPGERVNAGEPLVYLSTDSTLADGNGKSEQVLVQLREEMREIDIQLELSREQQELENAGLLRQLQAFDREVDALSSRLGEQKRRVGLGREKLRRIEGIAASGAVSEWELLRQREELAALEVELGRLEQELATQHREHESLQAQRDSTPVRARIQRSTLRAHRTQLAQQIAEHESRRLSVLTAPVAGTVASVEIHAGDSIAARQLLMTVLPDDLHLAAEIYVPSRAVGFVRPGQEVRISYDAFPQQKFGTFNGQIEHVSSFVVLPGEIPQPFPVPEATYKVQVNIHDAAIATSIGVTELRPGMLLAAEIVLEQRNFIDWLLEPLHLRRDVAR